MNFWHWKVKRRQYTVLVVMGLCGVGPCYLFYGLNMRDQIWAVICKLHMLTRNTRWKCFLRILDPKLQKYENLGTLFPKTLPFNFFNWRKNATRMMIVHLIRKTKWASYDGCMCYTKASVRFNILDFFSNIHWLPLLYWC